MAIVPSFSFTEKFPLVAGTQPLLSNKTPGINQLLRGVREKYFVRFIQAPLETVWRVIPWPFAVDSDVC